MDIESVKTRLIAYGSGLANDCISVINLMQAENARLRAEIDAANAQEPVKGTYWRDNSGVFTQSPMDSDLRLYLRPIPAQQSPALETTEPFSADQWWVGELNDATKNGTPDQQRAYCVVLNLLRQVKQSPAVTVPDDCEICKRSKYAMATLRYILNLDQNSNKTLSETVTDIVNKYAAYPPIESSDAIIARAALKKLADLNAANFSTPSPRITEQDDTDNADVYETLYIDAKHWFAPHIESGELPPSVIDSVQHLFEHWMTTKDGRVTEQDALAIAESLEPFFDNVAQSFDLPAWHGSAAPALLEKLNKPDGK